MPEPRPADERILGTRLDALLNLLDHGVLLLDEEYRVAHANPAFVTLVGVGVAPEMLRGSVLPAGPASYTHAYDAPDAAREQILAALGRGRPAGGDRHPMTGGRTVAHDYTPITADGTTVGHLWILRDVTGQAGQGADHDHPAGGERRSEFAAAVAHELRTPATAVAAFAAMLGDDDAAGRQRAAETVRRNAERMLLLAADLMLLSDLDAATAAPGDAPVDVPSLIALAAGAADPAAQVETGAGPPVTGDPSLLRQAVAIAIAVTAGADAGHSEPVTTGRGPHVRASFRPGCWTVTVTAAPAERPVTAERLLAIRIPHPDDPQASRTAALALQLARAIAVRHGGDLVVDDSAGYAVTLRLPAS